MPAPTILLGRRRRRPGLGLVAGASTALLLLCGAVASPAYVTEGPGPTFNTIGEYKGHQLISISGAKTYPTSGQLDMTTVSVAGGPNGATNALTVLVSFLDPGRTAVPSDAMYDPRTTGQEVSTQNNQQMAGSQSAAQAAATKYLGLPYTEKLLVQGTAQGAAAQGIPDGARLTSLDGKKLTDYAQLQQALADGKGKAVRLGYTASGQSTEKTVTAVPRHDTASDRWLLGLYLKRDYDFPFTVTYGLDSVGGPSAGTMFALGIIDEATPGEMTGGKHIAGTGTIDENGTVGAIGGIRQKMIGARSQGADYFLAPASNCDEVVGHVPDGLHVVKISTLKDAVHDVEEIGRGTDPGTLDQCR